MARFQTSGFKHFDKFDEVMFTEAITLAGVEKKASPQSAPWQRWVSTIQRQIDATDKQIDQLVCESYSLAEEEIKIVEGRA